MATRSVTYTVAIDVDTKPFHYSLFCERYRSGANFDKRTSFRCWESQLRSATLYQW